MRTFADATGIAVPRLIEAGELALRQALAALIAEDARDVADVVEAAIAMLEGGLVDADRAALQGVSRKVTKKRRSRRATLVRWLLDDYRRSASGGEGRKPIFASLAAIRLLNNRHAIAPHLAEVSADEIDRAGPVMALSARILVELNNRRTKLDDEGFAAAAFRGAGVPAKLARDWVSSALDDRNKH
jgi:hypothetical protein